jgi:TfoX/Sxy family transcriptional regulator of competence genes
MATSPQTIAHLLDILPDGVTARAMFGEYALYLDGRVVALVCDDALFVKLTKGAAALLPDCETGLPYPGAKPHLVIDSALDDADLMARLFRQVVAEVPMPKPRKKK